MSFNEDIAEKVEYVRRLNEMMDKRRKEKGIVEEEAKILDSYDKHDTSFGQYHVDSTEPSLCMGQPQDSTPCYSPSEIEADDSVFHFEPFRVGRVFTPEEFAQLEQQQWEEFQRAQREIEENKRREEDARRKQEWEEKKKEWERRWYQEQEKNRRDEQARVEAELRKRNDERAQQNKVDFGLYLQKYIDGKCHNGEEPARMEQGKEREEQLRTQQQVMEFENVQRLVEHYHLGIDDVEAQIASNERKMKREADHAKREHLDYCSGSSMAHSSRSSNPTATFKHRVVKTPQKLPPSNDPPRVVKTVRPSRPLIFDVEGSLARSRAEEERLRKEKEQEMMLKMEKEKREQDEAIQKQRLADSKKRERAEKLERQRVEYENYMRAKREFRAAENAREHRYQMRKAEEQKARELEARMKAVKEKKAREAQEKAQNKKAQKAACVEMNREREAEEKKAQKLEALKKKAREEKARVRGAREQRDQESDEEEDHMSAWNQLVRAAHMKAARVEMAREHEAEERQARKLEAQKKKAREEKENIQKDQPSTSSHRGNRKRSSGEKHEDGAPKSKRCSPSGPDEREGRIFVKKPSDPHKTRRHLPQTEILSP